MVFQQNKELLIVGMRRDFELGSAPVFPAVRVEIDEEWHAWLCLHRFELRDRFFASICMHVHALPSLRFATDYCIGELRYSQDKVK